MAQAPSPNSHELSSESDEDSMASNRSSERRYLKACALKYGEFYDYTIPYFSVITVPLKHTVIQTTDDSGEIVVLDAFFRDDPSLNVPLPQELRIYDACIVDVDVFAMEVQHATTMRLIDNSGVFVVWEWELEYGPGLGTYSEVTTVEESFLGNASDDDASTTSDISDDEVLDECKPHTVTFKCIGATRDDGHQIALRKARDRLEEGHSVSVKIQPEPDNIKDPNAIAFMCLLDGHYVRIGYVVSELLEEVHEALNSNKVLDVKFSWIKYLTNWTFSGPGYFAGIDVTKKGVWSAKAIISSSAR